MNKQKDYDLKDYIWEEEDFEFQPKVNRHKKFLHAKKRQLEKERKAFLKDKVIQMDNEIYEAKKKNAEKRIAYEDYDLDFDEEEKFINYKIH